MEEATLDGRGAGMADEVEGLRDMAADEVVVDAMEVDLVGVEGPPRTGAEDLRGEGPRGGGAEAERDEDA